MNVMLRLVVALFTVIWYEVIGDCSGNNRILPQWSSVYTVKGNLTVPYIEWAETFQAWYDSPNKQSRVDYDVGMMQTYQLRNSGPYGTSLKVTHVTTEREPNAKKCLQLNGSSEVMIQPQPALPSLVGFKCMGLEMIDGVDNEKWQLVETTEQKVNTYTLWLKYKDDPNNASIKYAVPTRYEVEGHNSLPDNHYNHYYINYYSYNIDDIDPKVFKVDDNLLPCSVFTGPGENHIYTFNPMKEFVFPTNPSHVDYEFDKFRSKHGKDDAHVLENEKRKEAFKEKVNLINGFNRKNVIILI